MDQSQEKTITRKMKFSLLIPLSVLVLACAGPSSFETVEQLYQNFDTLLSPREFAETVRYKKNTNGVWETPNGELVTIDIPFGSHYLSFGSKYAAAHPDGVDGMYTDHILRYENGVVTRQFFRFEEFPYNGIRYERCYYVVVFATDGSFEKAILYDTNGNVIQEAAFNFLIA